MHPIVVVLKTSVLADSASLPMRSLNTHLYRPSKSNPSPKSINFTPAIAGNVLGCARSTTGETKIK
jgi:hypothetical protein